MNIKITELTNSRDSVNKWMERYGVRFGVYKNGVFSTIDFNLKGRTLTIGARKGSYPGMLENRKFRIVYYGKGVKGEKAVEYNGSQLKINL